MDSIQIVLDFYWLDMHTMALPYELASQFVSNLMDVLGCIEMVNFLMGTYLLPHVRPLSTLQSALENYDILQGSNLVGGVISKQHLLVDYHLSKLLCAMAHGLLNDCPQEFSVRLRILKHQFGN